MRQDFDSNQPAPASARGADLGGALRRAIVLHQSGELAAAERAYLSIVEAVPDHVTALRLAGVVAAQRGRLADARQRLQRVLAIDPHCADALSNLGNVQRILGERAEALASYDRAVELKPHAAEILYNRGALLCDLERFDEALASFDQALAIAPHAADIHYRRGFALHRLQRYEEALATFDRLLAKDPDLAQAHCTRAATLAALNRNDEALASCDRALAAKPDLAEAVNNRGIALKNLRRYDRALSDFDRALTLKPEFAEALNNRGSVLKDLGRFDEALRCFGKALALSPGHPDVLQNRATALATLGRHEEAVKDFDQALSRNPKLPFAQGALHYSRMQCCDWPRYGERSAEIIANVRAGHRSIDPFMFLAVSDSPQDQLRCARTWSAAVCPPASAAIWTGERYRHDRIRVAYISDHFRLHPLGFLMAELFERHDRNRFEIIALSSAPSDQSAMRSRLEHAFDRFIDVGPMSDRDIAQLLAQLEIDIAVDRNGFTTGARSGALALRGAPIQVSYLAFPATMGVDYIDYIIADKVIIREEERSAYSESVVYLPDSYLVNDSTRRIAAATPSRDEAGLPTDGFVFCSFNNSYKITPIVFDVWMRVMREVDGSVLWLLETNDAAVRNLRREAAQRGIAPERLVFASRTQIDEHLARHRLADLFLDTLPYNAHTTASDALWAGLPVLTCLGATFAGRVAASLLHAIGLPELVTHSLGEYEALALHLATDAGALGKVVKKLREQRLTYPLFDTDRFRRHLESAYVTMWERYQRGEPPASFAVEPGRRSPPPNRDTHAFRHALALHRSGKLLEAERAYLAIVDADPRHADALRLAGVVAAQGGRLAEARDRLQRALAIDPQSADAHSNLGNVERAEGHHEAALASYDRAVVLKPHAAEILYNRGVLLADLGRLDEAIACFDRALAANARAFEIHYHRGLALYRVQRFEDALASFDRVLEANPDSPKALNNRGAALSSLKRYDEARMSLDRALAIDPAHAEALSNRGIALMGLRRFDDALESFDRALALTPDSPAMLANRASALLALRRHEEAIASCDSALALAPDFAEALNARGAALRHLGRHDEALASLERALALKPDFLEALNNRGGVLKEVQRYDEALASYDRALAHHPRFAEALQHRGAVLAHLSRHEEASNDFTRALELEPDLPFAAGALLRAKMQCCDWSGFDDACARINADVQAGKHAVDPFVFLGLQSSVTHQLQCARTWVDHAFRPASTALWTGERYRHDRIRLAYLSADFHDHPMAHLMAGLFEMHDRTRFETIAISLNEFGGSAIEARLQQAFGNFIVVARQTDREVAARLRELEVDIAVDLNGFTHGCRAGILALRPAPIQVNYLGYPGTMGAPYIDYIVADECVIPLEHRASFTEKIAYLPDTYQVNDSRRRIASATASRAEAGLPETGIVFCSFNASYKITPAMFDIWMRLLRDVDGSVLWLLRGNASVPRNLRREAMARGVAPERLVFADRVPLADHLARHRLADLFLDTLPYNAHTTASDALWAGLPVLTCLGTTFAGRVAASLNAAIGLSDLTTRTLRDYESLAFHLATDPVMLAETKQKLARHRESHPLFDTDRFRRHLEAAYIMMWKRYQRGEPPASFTTGSLA